MYMIYGQNPKIREECERRFSTNCFPNYTVINIVNFIILFIFAVTVERGTCFPQNVPVDNTFLRSRNVTLLYVD